MVGGPLLPKLGQGADLRIGRYISLPDIEAQLAPNNSTYSHSRLLYDGGRESYREGQRQLDGELSYTHAFSPYGLRALDISPGASVSALQNAPANQLPEATMRALGAKTQSLTLAADIIWHF